MKIINLKIFFRALMFMFFMSLNAIAQLGVGTIAPNTSSMLDVDVSTLPANGKKGFLPPRMDTAARDLIASPATALLIYNIDTNKLNYYNGTSWQVVETGAGSYVDLTTNQLTIGGNKTFTNNVTVNGTLTALGRLMIPMGEISYFDSSAFGFKITTIVASSTGTASGTDNMVKIAPPSGTVFVNDNFGTGANNVLTYIGAVERYFHIALSFSYSPDFDKDVFIFGVAKRPVATGIIKVEDSSKLLITTGNKAEFNSTAMHVLLKLKPNDSIEFYVGNVTSTRPLYIKSFNFVAIGM